MKRTLIALLEDETGAVATEYVLLASLIAIAALAGVTLFGAAVGGRMQLNAMAVSAAH